MSSSLIPSYFFHSSFLSSFLHFIIFIRLLVIKRLRVNWIATLLSSHCYKFPQFPFFFPLMFLHVFLPYSFLFLPLFISTFLSSFHNFYPTFGYETTSYQLNSLQISVDNGLQLLARTGMSEQNYQTRIVQTCFSNFNFMLPCIIQWKMRTPAWCNY